ncbi:MAG TPA: septal ring lytic transglycosylase RlpA family protein [Steroidobacteraceae bacterium]|nr:septal ring lytic transglycosylase RlpA family protein [Steroidobacteraceae bacterium]
MRISWRLRTSWRLRAGMLTVLLAGCSSAPHPRPTVAQTPVAPAATQIPTAPSGFVPDAIPKFEPRSQYGNPPFYTVNGHRYTVLASSNGYVERGVASWYGTEFHGLKTSTGEPYDMFAMTAAHKTLPLPCYARVTNLTNGRSVVVRINDRGPFVDNRIIDLSYSAANRLDMIRRGTAFVQVEVLTPASPPINAALPVNVPAASSAAVGVSSVPAITGSGTGTTTAAPDDGVNAASPPATPTASAAPAGTAGGDASAAPTSTFYIQVGAYSKAANAESTARRLKEGGIAQVVTLAPTATQPLARVRVGPIRSVQQFDSLFAKLTSLGFPNARLAQD